MYDIEKDIENVAKAIFNTWCKSKLAPQWMQEDKGTDFHWLQTLIAKPECKQSIRDLHSLCLNEARAALNASNAVKELRELEAMNGWQDISTAPKDGSRIITIVTGFLPTVGWWKNNEWSNDRQEADRLIGKQNDTGDDFTEYDYSPTHWKPLPTPPIQKD